MIIGAENEWPTVAAAAIGAAAALLAALVAKLRIGEKRRWDDELLNVASAFVAEARQVLTYARRLGTDADQGASAPHRRVRSDNRSQVLTLTEEHLFQMRELFVRLKLLANHDAQRSARLMIQHAWIMVEVMGHGQPDHRAGEYPGVTPLDRFINETDRFLAHIRMSLRVRHPKQLFTEEDFETERRQRGQLTRYQI